MGLFGSASAPEEIIERHHYNKVFLIDADFLKYYVGDDIAKYWDNAGDPEIVYGPDYLNHFLDERLGMSFFNWFSAWGYIFCFSGNRKRTFRYSVAVEKEYKGNRKTTDPPYPKYFADQADIISLIGKNYPTVIYEDFEADDIVSALQTPDTVIYSHDKDMKQVEGLHYNLENKKVGRVTRSQACIAICTQLIQGDTTDNIPGIPQMGPKKTEAVISDLDWDNPYGYVLNLYRERFGDLEGTDRFVESWNLIKMRMFRGEWFLSHIKDAVQIRDLIIEKNKES